MKILCIIILMLLTGSLSAQDMYATASSRAMDRFYLDTVPVTVKISGRNRKGFAVYSIHQPGITDTFHVKGKAIRKGYTTVSIVDLYVGKTKYAPDPRSIGKRSKTFTVKYVK